MISFNEIKKWIKYFFSSGTSFLIDQLLFNLFFNYIINNIIISTIFARILSSLYNYFMNSRLVFKNYTKSSIYKYYILVVIQMFVSAFLVSGISNLLVLNDNVVSIVKIIIDVLIFVVNYFIQREVVFK